MVLFIGVIDEEEDESMNEDDRVPCVNAALCVCVESDHVKSKSV